MTSRGQTWLSNGGIGTSERAEHALTTAVERGRATMERTAERGNGSAPTTRATRHSPAYRLDQPIAQRRR
eukprot:4693086-Pyramimonas_sp.AAC.1